MTPPQVQDADVEDEALLRVQDNSNNHNFMIAEDLNFIENEGWEPIPVGHDLSWFLGRTMYFLISRIRWIRRIYVRKIRVWYSRHQKVIFGR